MDEIEATAIIMEMKDRITELEKQLSEIKGEVITTKTFLNSLACELNNQINCNYSSFGIKDSSTKYILLRILNHNSFY